MALKKLEEFFNLPPSESVEACPDAPIEKTKEELMIEAEELYKEMSTSEKVDNALPVVTGLDSHDNDMDDIAEKAIRAFDDFILLGGNTLDAHAGKIYEVASQMLKIALDAKNAKAEKKLKMIELQLKKVRAEQIDFEQGNGNFRKASGVEFDRNELLKHIISAREEK